MTKLEKPRGRLIRLLEGGDTHLIAKVLLKDLVDEMIDSFPYSGPISKYDKWFSTYLRKGQVYTYGSCHDCDWYSTEICNECIKCGGS